MKYTGQEHCKRAFTLIEILIVTAIIGITASVFLFDWSGNRTMQYLDNGAQGVEAVVREAQNAALSGVQVSATDRPCGYRVAWAGSNYTVTYRYKDAGGGCNQSSQLSTHSLSNGVVFSGSGNFDFSLPYGTVSANQTIVLTKQSVSHVVCVYTSGKVATVSGSTCP